MGSSSPERKDLVDLVTLRRKPELSARHVIPARSSHKMLYTQNPTSAKFRILNHHPVDLRALAKVALQKKDGTIMSYHYTAAID